ncbi:SMI1/KNR4 family protein [Streptomyces sp. HC307]|uniref:SMI1/KNR4 family protein n=1 Tax=Streptomyces flavusporus TaxID=3385496 RepID=UPI003916EF79
MGDEVAAQVRAAWARIEKWMAAHAPGSLAMLRPAATEKQITAAETILGVRLPPALRAWYLLHDGSVGTRTNDFQDATDGSLVTNPEWRKTGWLPPCYAWYQLDRMVSKWQARTTPEGGSPDRAHLPLTVTAGDAWSGLFMDADPERATFGRVAAWSIGSLDYASESDFTLPQWLEEIASALEAGRCLRGADGVDMPDVWPHLDEEEGALAWGDPEDMEEEDRTIHRGPR